MQAGLLLLALGAPLTDAPAPQPWGSVWASVQASTGAEWDTNAQRSVGGDLTDVLADANRPTEQVSDGLLRMLVDTQAILRLGKPHRLQASYTLGAKRFFRESTEDLLTHNLTVTTLHRWSPRWDLGVSGWLQSSRIRRGTRDYNLGIGQATLGLRLADSWRLELGAGGRGFRFYAEDNFDYWGPQASLRLSFSPEKRWAASVRGAWVHRRYRGPALIEVDQENGRTILAFCDETNRELYDCVPGNRLDHEGQLDLGGRWQSGPLLLRGGYLLRLQRSTGDLENINRHRLYLNLTWALPVWGMTSNLMGTLQLNDGVSVTDQKFLAQDDENQNALRVQLRKPLNDTLDLELNYALFANQFSTADVSFVRQTVFLGLRVHLDGKSDLGVSAATPRVDVGADLLETTPR